MYTIQYTPQYLQYNQQYRQCPIIYYQISNYNRQPAYYTLPPTQTVTKFISPTVPVQQPQASTPGQSVSSLWMGGVCFVK